MKAKSRVTEYTDACICCGRPATHIHHLLFGSGREFADKYGLTIPVCASCHNGCEWGVQGQIHDNPRAEDLSKILGQAIWEKNYYKDLYYQLNRDEGDEARRRFIELFGNSYM